MNRYRLPALHLRAFCLLGSAFCALTLGGCDSNPDDPDDPLPVVGVPVDFGSDVSATARAHVQAFESLLGSVGVDAGTVEVPEGGARPLVFAFDDSENPLFAARAEASGATLDARSTALALATSLFGTSFAVGIDPDQAESRVAAHEDFAALVAAIRALSEAGTSYLDSEQVVASAMEIAADVSASFPPLDEGNARLGGDPVSFPTLPVVVEDAPGTAYTLVNGAYTWFNATATDTTNGQVVGAQRLARRDTGPWYPISSGDPTRTDLSGRDAPVRITVAFDDQSAQEYVKQAVADVIAGLLALSGARIEQADQQFAYSLATESLQFFNSTVLLSQDWTAVRESVWAVIRTNSAFFATRLAAHLQERFGEQVAARFLRTAFRSFAVALPVLEATLFIVQRYPIYRDTNAYWYRSESVIVCSADGVIGLCRPSIAGTYQLISYRGVGMGGICGVGCNWSEPCSSCSMRVDRGTAVMREDYWTMEIWTSNSDGQGGFLESHRSFFNSGPIRFTSESTEYLNVPQESWCMGSPHLVDGYGYCSQLPPGWLYEFQFFSHQPFLPYAVLLEDADTMVSGIGGQTVWLKE